MGEFLAATGTVAGAVAAMVVLLALCAWLTLLMSSPRRDQQPGSTTRRNET